MEQQLQEIVKLHAEMEEITLEAGVSKTVYSSILRMPSDILPKEVQERADWLYRVRHRQYEAVRAIWSELPATTWKMYESLRGKTLTGHAELIRRRKALKEAWKEWHGKANEAEQEADSRNSR